LRGNRKMSGMKRHSQTNTGNVNRTSQECKTMMPHTCSQAPADEARMVPVGREGEQHSRVYHTSTGGIWLAQVFKCRGQWWAVEGRGGGHDDGLSPLWNLFMWTLPRSIAGLVGDWCRPTGAYKKWCSKLQSVNLHSSKRQRNPLWLPT
jgi:hypothetical protein